ncbi:MAG TPA: helix-turn-helix domain-containing protein [Methyloceanibacter sp.]|nr:helix-turn-helix domain-containing protein [Methyloceanibacter sp.]
MALSRSALAERFTDMSGAPPMQYLTQWRLTLAAQALRAGSDGIARIAERSGYDSEAAFTRAFSVNSACRRGCGARTEDAARRTPPPAVPPRPKTLLASIRLLYRPASP